MTRPQIAIVGSADLQRTDYEPGLQNTANVKVAAEELGRELAKAGYDIIVYSSDPAFIEADVVRGYVGSQSAVAGSIHVRYPLVVKGTVAPSFPEQGSHSELFNPLGDSHENWQVSFYTSLKDAAGILLLGGANSALITGLVAQMYSIPLIAIATFGGSAQTVWRLRASRLADEVQYQVMNRPSWNSDSAQKLVGALTAQRERLAAQAAEALRNEQRDRSALRDRAIIAAALTICSLASAVVGAFVPLRDPLVFGLLFLLTPLLAGGSGGIARNVFDYYRGVTSAASRSSWAAAVLGMIAGVMSGLLFVLAQLTSNPEIRTLRGQIPPGMSILILFELIIGFIAGLTLETVFTKMQSSNVFENGPPTQKQP